MKWHKLHIWLLTGLLVLSTQASHASATASHNRSTITANHAAVAQQSGIYAGHGGFDVDISGHTQLDGGLITSSAAAETAGKNHFSTATLGKTDIHNHSTYRGNSLGIHISASGRASPQDNTIGHIGNTPIRAARQGRADGKLDIGAHAGAGRDSGHITSTTASGIGTKHITITDEAAQKKRTGQSVEQATAAIRSNTTTEQALKQQGLDSIYDRGRVQKELELQTATTQNFGEIAPNLIASFADRIGNTSAYETVAAYQEQLQQQLAQTQDPHKKATLTQQLTQIGQYLAENHNAYQTWKEGGIGRAIAQAATGALMTGTGTGAVAAGTASLAAPVLNAAQDSLPPAGAAILNTVGAAAIGYAAGGQAGAVTAANVDWHNRQLHRREIQKIQKIAAQFAKEKGITEQQAQERLLVQAMRQVDKTYYEAHANHDIEAQNFLRANSSTFFAENEKFLEFAPGQKYYSDPNKFADQKPYLPANISLDKQPVYTEQQKNNRIKKQVAKTILAGTGKGIINTPTEALNGAANWVNEFTHEKFGALPNVKNISDYENEIEAEIGAKASNTTLSIATSAIGARLGKPSVKESPTPNTSRGNSHAAQAAHESAAPQAATNQSSTGGGFADYVAKEKQITAQTKQKAEIEQNVANSQAARNSSNFPALAQKEWEQRTGMNLNHIVGADYRAKKGKVTGGHSTLRADVRVLEVHGQPDKHGVYQATVEIKKPDGTWQVKQTGSLPHTMFPKHWDETKIRHEVESAWKNSTIKGNQWTGTSASGIRIKGFLEPKRTAYPIYQNP